MTRMQHSAHLKSLVTTIAKQFAPDRIILFGSYAWGQPHGDSDIDLLVIKKTSQTEKVARQIDLALWERDMPLDVLVYTPAQIKERIKMKDSFVKDVLENGKVLYERK